MPKIDWFEEMALSLQRRGWLNGGAQGVDEVAMLLQEAHETGAAWQREQDEKEFAAKWKEAADKLESIVESKQESA